MPTGCALGCRPKSDKGLRCDSGAEAGSLGQYYRDSAPSISTSSRRCEWYKPILPRNALAMSARSSIRRAPHRARFSLTVRSMTWTLAAQLAVQRLLLVQQRDPYRRCCSRPARKTRSTGIKVAPGLDWSKSIVLTGSASAQGRPASVTNWSLPTCRSLSNQRGLMRARRSHDGTLRMGGKHCPCVTRRSARSVED